MEESEDVNLEDFSVVDQEAICAAVWEILSIQFKLMIQDMYEKA